MSRNLCVAAVQMDAAPASLNLRLAAAETMVAQAAAAGAELIVLPELFNLGYSYSDDNYAAAEPLDGPTTVWMKATAARFDVHLAGSILLQDGGDIRNALLLLAPDGRQWRYDKIYPWGWERAFFRGGRETVVAHTDLGAIGFLICWDTAHPRLWRRYAGAVDFIVCASCPPQVTNPVYRFDDGDELTFNQMGPLLRRIQGSDKAVFGGMLNEQAAWLGVPVINSVGCGQIETHLPNPRASLLAMAALWPPLLRRLPQASQATMLCAMTPGCKVIGGDGRTLAERAPADGPGFSLAQVKLAAERAQPIGRQPASRVPRLAYFISDFVLPFLSQFAYQQRRR
jgi:hypothetical protein